MTASESRKTGKLIQNNLLNKLATLFIENIHFFLNRIIAKPWIVYVWGVGGGGG